MIDVAYQRYKDDTTTITLHSMEGTARLLIAIPVYRRV